MKILLYGINYAPELTGIGKYSSELCQWLTEQGHNVRVITAPPYYPAWKQSKGYSYTLYSTEKVAGVSVIRCPLWVPSSPTGIKRIIHLLSYTASSTPVVIALSLFWKPDIIIAIEPPFFCALPAWLGAKIANAKSWLHIQDFEIDASVRVGFIKDSFILKLLFKFEKWLLGNFNTVSTISERMLIKLHEKEVPSSKCYYFPNWIDSSFIFPTAPNILFKTSLGISENKKVALYSGNMGRKQGLDIILDAAKLLTHCNYLIFILCGTGAMYEEILTASHDLDNLILIPLQQPDRFNDLLNIADVHLLPQQAGMDEFVMPSKLLGILASGRPVVGCASEDTELAKIISAAGVVVPSADAHKFADAIISVITSPDLSEKLGKRGRELCVSTWEKNLVLTKFNNKLLSQQF